MNSLPHAERRTDAGAGPKVTYAHRQPRPADPDLGNMDRRIVALEALGDARGHRGAVALLRRRWTHLERDQHTRIAGWYGDAASLTIAIDREERYKS